RDAGMWSGSAYVFARGGGVWGQRTKRNASDAAAGSQFGYSVSVDEGTPVVGAPFDNNIFGSAYVYEPAPSFLSDLSPARVWVGLKNGDDAVLRLDLLVEVFID